MFTENSGLVKIWVRQIEQGNRTFEEVPVIENLKEIIAGILNISD